MKKSILAVAGLAAVAGVAAVPMGAYADLVTSQTDTLKVTIDNSCQLTYQSGGSKTAHADGTNGKWGTGETANTLSVKIANNTADTAIGTTNFNVVCNDLGGFDVTLTPTALTGETNTTETIPYISTSSAPVAGTSSWGVKNTDGWLGIASGKTTAKAATSSTATASTDFTVTYGAATSTTQAADTYTGTAAYSLTHPASK